MLSPTHPNYDEDLSYGYLSGSPILKLSIQIIAYSSALVFSLISFLSTACIIFITWKSWTDPSWPIPIYLFYFLIEAIFICVLTVAKYAHDLAKVDPALFAFTDKRAREKLYKEVLQTSPSVERNLRGFFYGLPLHAIQRENIQELFASVCFNKSTAMKLDKNQRQEIDELIDKMEAKLGHKFERGYSPATRSMRIGVDPILVWHKPLVYYIIVFLCSLFCDAFLRLIGFSQFTCKNLSYWKRVKNSDSKHTPVVFFHGLGIGLFPYIPLLSLVLLYDSNIPLYLIQKDSVSTKLHMKFLYAKEYADNVSEILDSCGVNKAVFVGHSLGSVCLNWMHKYHPELVSSSIFIDPVCFMQWEYDMVYNFMYRSPSTFTQFVLKYYASTEFGISTYVRRYLWGNNSFCHTEDLPSNASIYISENDGLVPANALMQYLQKHGPQKLRIVFFKNLVHGQFLIVYSQISRVVIDIVNRSKQN